MSVRGESAHVLVGLQLCAALCGAMRVSAEPPDGGAHEHAEHDDHGAEGLHEREQALSRSLTEDGQRGSPSPPAARGPHWNGPWVSAVVGRDGIAHFQDRSVLSTGHAATWYDQQYNRRIRNTLPPQTETERSTYAPWRDAPFVSLRFRFDLDDLVGDRNQAARAQMLESSERLRTWLSLQDRLCSSLDSRALKEYLSEVLPKLPVAQHKLALFETHDACADSALGVLARKLIYQAVELSFPRSSRDAYTAAELKALNEERIAALPFEPY
jgi:hypothetical protein